MCFSALSLSPSLSLCLRHVCVRFCKYFFICVTKSALKKSLQILDQINFRRRAYKLRFFCSIQRKIILKLSMLLLVCSEFIAWAKACCCCHFGKGRGQLGGFSGEKFLGNVRRVLNSDFTKNIKVIGMEQRQEL